MALDSPLTNQAGHCTLGALRDWWVKYRKKLHKTYVKTRIFNSMKYHFADLLLDTGRNQLSRGDEKIALPRLSYRVLHTLLEASPDMVSPDELVDRAWGSNRVVTPENINQRIMLLRQSLGDDAQHPRYVEAVRGQGFRLIPDVHRGESLAERRQKIPLLAGIGLFVVLAATLWLSWPERVEESRAEPRSASSTESLPEIDLQLGPVVAVLPFESMSDDAETRFIGEGVSEDIIHTLVQQTGLPVVARTSSFQFRGQNLDGREIGQRLNATHLLEGSVRRSDTQVRVTAQLIDAPSGMHLWSEQYDLPIGDLFLVQSDIAVAIVNRIKDQLQAQGETRIQDAISLQTMQPMGRATPAAYEAYLKGLQHRNRLLPDDIRAALDHFQQAAKLSPGFFPAWRALITTQLIAVSFPIYIDYELRAYQRIEGWLDIAEPLHPDQLVLKAVRSYLLAVKDLEWVAGMTGLEEILPRLVHDPLAQSMAGELYLVLEREQASRDHLERALELDPFSPNALQWLYWLNWITGHPEESLRLLEGDEYPYFMAVIAGLGYFVNGQTEALDTVLRKARQYVDDAHTPVKNTAILLDFLLDRYEDTLSSRKALFSRMWEVPVALMHTTGPTSADLFFTYGVDAIEQRQSGLLYFIYLNRNEERLQPLLQLARLDEVPEPSLRLNHPTPEEIEAVRASAVPMTIERLQQYEGVYYVGDYKLGRNSLHVTVKDGVLYCRQPGRWDGELVAIGEHTFTSLNFRGSNVEFVPNDQGQIDLVLWNRGSADYYGYRRPLPDTIYTRLDQD